MRDKFCTYFTIVSDEFIGDYDFDEQDHLFIGIGELEGLSDLKVGDVIRFHKLTDDFEVDADCEVVKISDRVTQYAEKVHKDQGWDYCKYERDVDLKLLGMKNPKHEDK